jgi:hypothetical protein
MNTAREMSPSKPKTPHLSEYYQSKIRSLLVYLAFLCIFSYYSLRDLTSDDSYYLAANLKEQLAGVEHRAEHSPTTGDTFRDVSVSTILTPHLSNNELFA